MMSICRENSTNSFLSLPPSLRPDFSHPFHQTPSHHHQPLPPPPPLPPANGIPLTPFTTTTPASSPVDSLQSSADKCFASVAGTLAGGKDSGEGHMGFVDFGLLSCTESLGFESSDEISSLDFGSNLNDSSPTSTSSNGEDSSSSPSSSSSTTTTTSSPFSCSSSFPRAMKKWSQNLPERKEFPPPLTTMSENGRRNFVLRPERKDGRLEIVKVAIERPEVLYTSRQNGRLTMHLVRSFHHEFEDDEDDEFEEEDETEDEEEEEEQQQEQEDGEEEKEDDERIEMEVAKKAEEKDEQGREWKIPATGVRRCYQYHIHVWGHQQRRWVPTM